jgi:hypothetical protein
MSDEPKLHPTLSSLAISPTISNRTVSDTQPANASFELSDIDSATSFTGSVGDESFDSVGSLYQVSNRSQGKVASPDAATTEKQRSTFEGIARGAPRRSERIRNLPETREQRKLHQLTESLLFVRSALTDESEGGERSRDSLISETSSSTGNQAIASPDCDNRSSTKRGYQLQRSSNCERSLSESCNNNQHKTSLPRYVRVSLCDDRRDRRLRRSHSRDCKKLISTDSDKVAQ